MASVPGQFCPSPRLPRVSTDRWSGNGSFEPVELGLKTFYLLFDAFEFLQASVSIVRGSHPLNQYLVMLDECVHSTEGGLEGWEPISRLFRDIEENLDAFCDSLLLR